MFSLYTVFSVYSNTDVISSTPIGKYSLFLSRGKGKGKGGEEGRGKGKVDVRCGNLRLSTIEKCPSQ